MWQATPSVRMLSLGDEMLLETLGGVVVSPLRNAYVSSFVMRYAFKGLNILLSGSNRQQTGIRFCLQFTPFYCLTYLSFFQLLLTLICWTS